MSACESEGLHLVDSSGSITSPGFGFNVDYDNDLRCWWVLSPLAGHVVQLTFHVMDIEDSYLCHKDVLYVRNYATYHDVLGKYMMFCC